MHRMVDLKIEKDSLHLIKFMRGLYGLFCFSDVISAIRLKTVLLIGAKPPLVENISGEKQPCSTSRIWTSYSKKWLQNHPKFLLDFLIHIDVLMLCRKFELIPTKTFLSYDHVTK